MVQLTAGFILLASVEDRPALALGPITILSQSLTRFVQTKKSKPLKKNNDWSSNVFEFSSSIDDTT